MEQFPLHIIKIKRRIQRYEYNLLFLGKDTVEGGVYMYLFLFAKQKYGDD
jgi:hypothetical protein